MDYQEKANSVADRLLSYSKDESGWKICKKTNEVVVYWRPSSEFSGNVYKGEAVVSGSPPKVWECLKPDPNGLRVKWDDNVKKFELLEQVSSDITVCRTVTPSAAMGIISPRDFVDVILVKRYEDGTVTSNATHVSHPTCPPQPGYVRGFNHPCGCFCVPVPGETDKTKLISFFQTDLGGLLPRSVVDSFFPSSMTEFYANLTKAVKSLNWRVEINKLSQHLLGVVGIPRLEEHSFSAKIKRTLSHVDLCEGSANLLSSAGYY